MNSISWMIYAADVTGALDTIGVASAVSGAIAAVCTMPVYLATLGAPRVYSWENREEKIAYVKRLNALAPKLIRSSLIVCACGSLLAAIVPSKDTIYAIAASESIEQAAQTATAKKALAAVNAWLDKQIAPATERR